MEPLYEKRKNTFESGNVYCIRTSTKTLVGEVIDVLGGYTLRLKHVRNLDTGYETRPSEMYCIPYVNIVYYERIAPPVPRENESI